MKKRDIQEIIDDDGNLMGTDDVPKTGKDLYSRANRTTDYNATVMGQNFKNDFLGRFGFYFYESVEDGTKLRNNLAILMYEKFLETLEYYHKNPNKLAEDYEEHLSSGKEISKDEIDDIDLEWADKIMDIIEPFMKKNLNETKVVEDKIVKEKKDKEINSKKDENEFSKVNKVADLLSKLPKDQLNKLITLLEKYK